MIDETNNVIQGLKDNVEKVFQNVKPKDREMKIWEQTRVT